MARGIEYRDVHSPFAMIHLRRMMRRMIPYLILAVLFIAWGLYMLFSNPQEVDERFYLHERPILDTSQVVRGDWMPAFSYRTDASLVPLLRYDKEEDEVSGIGVSDVRTGETLAAFDGRYSADVHWVDHPQKNQIILIDEGLVNPRLQRIRHTGFFPVLVLPSGHYSRVYTIDRDNTSEPDYFDLPFVMFDPVLSEDGGELLAMKGLPGMMGKYYTVRGTRKGTRVYLETVESNEANPVLIDMNTAEHRELTVRCQDAWFETEQSLLLLRSDSILRYRLQTDEVEMVYLAEKDEPLRWVQYAQHCEARETIFFIHDVYRNSLASEPEYETFEVSTDGLGTITRRKVERLDIEDDYLETTPLHWNPTRKLRVCMLREDPQSDNTAIGLVDYQLNELLAVYPMPEYNTYTIVFAGPDHIIHRTEDVEEVLSIEDFCEQYPVTDEIWPEEMEP